MYFAELQTALVCVCEKWLKDKMLLPITHGNNLSQHRQAKRNSRAEFRNLELVSVLANLLVHSGEGREADGAVIKNNDQQLSGLFALLRTGALAMSWTQYEA